MFGLTPARISGLALAATLSTGLLASPALAGSCEGCGSDGKNYGEKTANLVEVASSLDTFSTLVAAVQAADLVETLQSEGPFTVFAPTNEAFAALPEGTVESLLLPENKDQLVAVLTYHVVPAKAKAKDVVKLDSVDTVQGSAVTISASEGEVFLNNDVKVIKTDVKASNGVIHVIDAVLLPPAE